MVIPLLQCGGEASRVLLGSAGPERAWFVLAATSGRLSPSGGGGCSLPRVIVMSTRADVASFRSYQPHIVGHGSMMVVTASPWWRVLVGGKLGGAIRSVWEGVF